MIEVKDANNIDFLKQFGNITFTWVEMNYVEMNVQDDAEEKIKKCNNVVTCHVSKKGKYQPYSLCNC